MKFPKEFPDNQLRIKKIPRWPHLLKLLTNGSYDQFKKNNLFANFVKDYGLFLSAPPSVCCKCTLIKWIKNKMSQNRLHYLMLISSKKDFASLIDLNKLTKIWVEMKTRIILLLLYNYIWFLLHDPWILLWCQDFLLRIIIKNH